MDNALLMQNFAKIEYFLLELRKCILTAGFTYVTPHWGELLATEIFCYRYSTVNNSAQNNIFEQNLISFFEIY